MNIPLLRQIQEQIVNEPKKFDMGDWGDRKPGCGTTCCIGGWAVAFDRGLSDGRKIFDLIAAGDTSATCSTYAIPNLPRDILGITTVQADRLFFTVNWPPRFEKAYQAAKTTKVRAEVAHARIEFFIETNGSDRRRKPKPGKPSPAAPATIEELIEVGVKR